MKEKYICPICVYRELYEPPSKESPTFEICHCCGIEFGYQDAKKSWEDLRKIWIKSGYKWFNYKKKPKNWNPKKQLQNLKSIKGL